MPSRFTPQGSAAIISPLWGRSSAGRAPRSQCGGRGFDPLRLHQMPDADASPSALLFQITGLAGDSREQTSCRLGLPGHAALHNLFLLWDFTLTKVLLEGWRRVAHSL